MKERPILFSGAMVRALLAGTKTQTRRIVKQQPERNDKGTLMWGTGRRTGLQRFGVDGLDVPPGVFARCPYGQAGDRLWVRESHAPQPDCSLAWDNWMRGVGGARPIIHYMADGSAKAWVDRWRPSIHMPRWASRITLEVVSVRVERLHELSEADAIAEGIEQMPCSVPDTRLWRNYDPSNGWTPSVAIPQNSYRSLWGAINGPDSWAANPWVWVVEFKRLP